MESKEYGANGLLRIENKDERVEVAAVLFKNGYAVAPVRRKEGRSFKYFVQYEYINPDLPEEVEE